MGIKDNFKKFLDDVSKEQAKQEIEKAKEMTKLIDEVKVIVAEVTDKLKRKD